MRTTVVLGGLGLVFLQGEAGPALNLECAAVTMVQPPELWVGSGLPLASVDCTDSYSIKWPS
jgi:hypothetical protein